MVHERPVRIERRLSAILAADVVDYSRLMHRDEEATHAKLTVLLEGSVAPAISEHGGRIVKNTGDGLLAEFPSAVEAVRAAVQFQTHIKELTTADEEDRRIAFRVGINVGDVIVEPHDVFGDGVNIAARLDSIAEPGSICISSSAYDYIQGKVGVEFTDLGEQNLKNIARPVRAYAMVRDGPTPALQADGAKRSQLAPPRRSIVVLPFANLSGDPRQDYFVDGVTESLTTDLSRISGSFVIGRHTAFTYKGKAVDLKKIARELNVRYVLEGSVQRSGTRLRVNVQLVDAESGNHIWAERFDKPVADLFDVQDEIVARLANALDAELIAAEARRAEHALSPDAMDLYFQGIAFANRGTTPEYLRQARSFFERALALDPDCIEALVGRAGVDEATATALLTDDPAPHLVVAEAMLTKALSLSPQHALAHLRLGIVLILTNRARQGIAECQRALALDRNLAHAHAWIGLAKVYIGHAAETETHVHEALRLSPRDARSYIWLLIAGLAKFHLHADAEAVACLRRSIETNRNHPLAHFWLAAALARLGAVEEAKGVAQMALALNPSFTTRRARTHLPSDDPVYVAGREGLYEGLRLAGVPDG
ncbi:adenylate/guanylate cyclase domain-containing protein [Bradyrhizobium canariense]|uniref:adenylate/guanylate cyclase domain-containing protein n=1 Tax=Bradyrhizobium canariense TaxID=255045 RepID=UPI000A18F011|nr:adenylate/guanylate cyclase domain-containing protein [Bradyrhizobium canariense]OSI35092.1 adenylate/guanylate cyclase domain-containing protein [Bradyrhizobium canariense]OSI40016.1 adenylate/guanylate cyclase domain-containing protein [Bradyrhizobium canariense]OSI54893.1 adenylate/guanylate cyclase domain-containing protein [Bradyrhizobium canariense]OSI57313.1 adenylate/guanylate cyclase domain-containing protein [Bradyrhizobium canariense]OSI59884.1 adenylate/guanylate cyclase domain-